MARITQNCFNKHLAPLMRRYADNSGLDGEAFVSSMKKGVSTTEQITELAEALLIKGEKNQIKYGIMDQDVEAVHQSMLKSIEEINNERTKVAKAKGKEPELIEMSEKFAIEAWHGIISRGSYGQSVTNSYENIRNSFKATVEKEYQRVLSTDGFDQTRLVEDVKFGSDVAKALDSGVIPDHITGTDRKVIQDLMKMTIDTKNSLVNDGILSNNSLNKTDMGHVSIDPVAIHKMGVENARTFLRETLDLESIKKSMDNMKIDDLLKLFDNASMKERSKIYAQKLEVGRVKAVTNEMYDSIQNKNFNEEEYITELLSSIEKSGFVSPNNVLGIMKFKSEKMGEVLQKISVNKNMYEHLGAHFQNYAGKRAAGARFGTDVSKGISELADSVGKTFGFRVPDKLVSDTKELIDPSLKRGGLPSRSSRVLSAMRWWNNITMLGRIVLSMIPETAYTGAAVGKLTGKGKIAYTTGSLADTVSTYFRSIIGKDFVATTANAKSYLDNSATLANYIPRFHDGNTRAQNKFTRFAEKWGERFSAAKSIDSSQRSRALGEVMATLNDGIIRNQPITKELQATLDQFGFTPDELALIRETKTWGGSAMLSEADKYLGTDKAAAMKTLAIKQDAYFDSISALVLARNNDTFKLKSGLFIGQGNKQEIAKTVLQYKQIIYEVTANLSKLGVKGDGYTQTAAAIADGIFSVSNARKFKSADTLYTIAMGTGLTFASMEARRIANGETGWWAGEDYWDMSEDGQWWKDLVASMASTTGGMSMGFEDLFTGEFDAGRVALGFFGPTARHGINTMKIASAAMSNISGEGRDVLAPTLNLAKQFAPLKTHAMMPIIYTLLNNSLHEFLDGRGYRDHQTKARRYRENRGAESFLTR